MHHNPSLYPFCAKFMALYVLFYNHAKDLQIISANIIEKPITRRFQQGINEFCTYYSKESICIFPHYSNKIP